MPVPSAPNVTPSAPNRPYHPPANHPRRFLFHGPDGFAKSLYLTRLIRPARIEQPAWITRSSAWSTRPQSKPNPRTLQPPSRSPRSCLRAHWGSSPAQLTSFTSSSLITPLNTLLLGLVAYVGYRLLKTPEQPELPPAEPPAVFRTYTPPTLFPFSGKDGKPIYLAIRGRVFDVSRKAHFYGPGGPYENFAGRDATRGLAMGSFDEEMLTKDLEGPLDDLQGLGENEMESLANWEESFSGQYPIIGRLVSVAEYEKEKQEKK